MEILIMVITIAFYIIFIKFLMFIVRGGKKRTDVNAYYRNVNENINQDLAFSPAMYNQPIEGVAKEFIQRELEEHNFTGKDSIPELEIKKFIATIIVSIILLIVELLIIFRINLFITILIILPTILIYIISLRKLNIYGILYKEFKAREDENMEYIISSYIQHRVSRIPFIITRLLIMVVLFIIPLIVFSKPKFFFEETEGGYNVRFYAGVTYPDEIVIPDSYNGKPVVGIRGNVFKNIKNVKKVVIPNTVTTISGHAFENDKNLSDIVLPNQLSTLGAYAFNRCSIDKIEIPETLKEIHSYTFANNSKLTEVTFNGEIDKIGSHAFYNDYSLTEIKKLKVKELSASVFENTGIHGGIELLEGMEVIPAYVFKKTKIKTIKIPSTITKISESAFEDSLLEEIKLPNGLTEISESAFRHTQLTTIVIPDSVTRISAHVFRECYFLKNVTLSKNITEIRASTFRNTAIESIVIPDKVGVIGESAFRSCGKLKSVKMPKSLYKIEDKAFRECSSLKSVTIPRGTILGEKVFKDSPTYVSYSDVSIYNYDGYNIDEVIEIFNKENNG